MKKINFKRKVVKGMTLMEIIIAIAIVAVMSAVIVTAGISINSYLRSARNVNDRVALQAPVAEVGDLNAGVLITEGVDIKLTPNGIAGAGEIQLHGQAYAVYDDARMQQHTNEFGKGLNMKFITDIETTTEAAT